MTIYEIILLAIALSVDSMAVSLSGSVSMGHPNWKKVAKVSLTLAVVQTAFLAGGYYAGEAVGVLVQSYGRYIGFAILLYLGASMLVDVWRGKDDEARDFSTFGRIVAAGVATSIDAVAAGASFGLTALPSADFLATAAATFIATILFAVSGMYCGSILGRKLGKPARIIAGIVLIIIGIRILIQ